MEVDVEDNDTGWRKFLRVRIKLHLAKPLAQVWSVQVKGKMLKIPIQYEKLPLFYFTCKRIVHTEDCKLMQT